MYREPYFQALISVSEITRENNQKLLSGTLEKMREKAREDSLITVSPISSSYVVSPLRFERTSQPWMSLKMC